MEMNSNDNGKDGAETPLFMSLIRSLQPHDELEINAKDAGESGTEPARQELEEWWRKAPFTTTSPPSRAIYERFYQQLARFVQRHKAADAENNSSLVSVWIAADWSHDQNSLGDCEMFQTSILKLVDLMRTVSASSSSSSMTQLSLIQELRHASLHDDAAVVVAQPVDESKPRSMAEKLAQMRERRSTMIKEGSLASLTKAATPTATTDTETSVTTAVSFTPSATDDDAAHLFTIETRLELKEKLRGLQTRLDTLLLETKLAWMKCFASEEQSNSGSDAATQLVTLGEALASHLLDAFTMARSPRCPIGEYKALVAACETNMASFQALVSSMASAPSPAKKNASKSKKPTAVEDRSKATDPPEEPRLQPQPVEFDLPSMKAYYAKAAPSYAAYFPKKTANRR